MKTDVIWIAGGIDKGNDYSELDTVVREKVKAIVCLGKDNSKIINAFTGTVPTIVVITSYSIHYTKLYDQTTTHLQAW